MKAWVLENQAPIEKEPLEIREVPDPQPGEGMIRIRISYCGLCRTDLHIVEGDLPLHKKPVILGHEIVGAVDMIGEGVTRFEEGDKVGLTWLYSTCGKCRYCRKGMENYCPHIKRTGWDVDGGYAEYVVAREDFVLDLNDIDLEDSNLAPLMCPGVAGYFAYKLSEIEEEERLGIIGFGPTAYYILLLAKMNGIEVYVSTRKEEHKELAARMGADWVGNIREENMPRKTDAIIYFPPTGSLVERALENLDRAGRLVLAPVSMTPLTITNYRDNLWGKRIITLYQVRRDYSREFIRIASKLKPQIDKEIVQFHQIQDALKRMKKGELKGLVAVAKIH